jgi:hypothetical protein
MSFHISKIHFDIFIHSYAPSIATGFPIHSILFGYKKKKKKKQFTELSIDEFLRLLGIIFGY